MNFLETNPELEEKKQQLLWQDYNPVKPQKTKNLHFRILKFRNENSTLLLHWHYHHVCDVQSVFPSKRRENKCY